MPVWFSTVEVRFLVDLALALLFGFLIGYERERRGKDAGISTHSLVIIGSMLFSFLSANSGDPDRTRIAAQVVTGIGFLGAGMIFRQEGSVKNLTTAASLWCSGAIGMALGFDHHFIAAVACLACVLIPMIPPLGRHSRSAD